MMSAPFAIPLSVVRTPLALFTAVRVIDPVTGIDCKNDPNMLHMPNANISCVASIVFPLAIRKNAKAEKLFFNRVRCSQKNKAKCHRKVLTKCFGNGNTFEQRDQWQRNDCGANVCYHIGEIECFTINFRMKWWNTDWW